MNKAEEGLLLRFWRDYVSSYTWILVFAGVFMMVEGGSLGLVSYYVKPMFDEIFVSGDQDAITELSVIMFFIFAARGLAAFLQRSLTMYVGLNVIADLQRNLLSHLLTLDAAFYHQHSPGALIERVRGDAQTLQQVSSNALIIIGRDSFSLIALLAVALYIDWKWMGIALLSAPLIVLPVWMVQKLVRKTTYAAREASASISSRLDEIFHGFKAIKINNTETHESKRFSAGIRQFVEEEYKAELGKAALPSLIDIIAGLGFVGVMIYGGQQIIAGEKTVGDFMSFFTALALVFDPLRRLTGVGGQLQAALASLERLYQLFDARAAIENPASPLPFDHTANGDIRFERVTFAYDAHKPVLQNLSFVVPQGKMTALVGPSGAGKTTVFNLLTRLEEAQAGEIYCGERLLSELDIRSLREHIAVVSQESALFDETIEQNVKYGRFDAEESRVHLALRHALVDEFMEELPAGSGFRVGPRGANLSGGQRQRVVIARAMLKDCPILLLDEATSALDRNTEEKIQRAIEHAARDRTVIVIAHRLSTIIRADLIHVMDKGRVIESGTHYELLARQGMYASLYHQLEQQ